MIQNNNIFLNDALFLGEGNARKCYIHPKDNNLCIKILFDKTPKRGPKREVKYYKKLQKRNISWKMLAKYLYTVQTNLGKGDVFELVRDFDGEISKSMRYYLSLNNENINKQTIQLLEDLRQYLINEKILFTDLNPTNILLKKINKTAYTLVVIDGIGHNNDFPMFEYITILVQKKLIRKWEKYRLKWISEFPFLKGHIKTFNA